MGPQSLLEVAKDLVAKSIQIEKPYLALPSLVSERKVVPLEDWSNAKLQPWVSEGSEHKGPIDAVWAELQHRLMEAWKREGTVRSPGACWLGWEQRCLCEGMAV